MKKMFLLFLCLVFLFVKSNYAQVENIEADNSVYTYLKTLQVQGIINGFNDIVLPLSRGEVNGFLLQAEQNIHLLSNNEKDQLLRYKVKFFDNENIRKSVINGLPDSANSAYNLYYLKDSIVSLYVDPIVNYKMIYSDTTKKSATLFNIGVRIKGTYSDWLGFYFKVTNGLVSGDRNTAKYDNQVRQSFTFNNTGINYADATSGYIKMKKGIIDFELGRERILWGTGYLNKIIFSDNPQMFDFVKLHVKYGDFDYQFLHGWLVQKPNHFDYPEIKNIMRLKEAKYIAVSRLGYEPNNSLKFGISQVLIYSNRPFELAYMNPLIFFESAQRSLNDIDNSFLQFDGRALITNGLELNASIMLDDINFERLGRGEWNGSNNGLIWQTGGFFTYPLIPKNFALKIEYLQIRPYMFSHWGINESLTYTSNGYLLGVNLNPNSTMFSSELTYNFTGELKLNILFNHILHGNNIYDSEGKRIKNVGGNVFESSYHGDSIFANLLDGNIEKTNQVNISLGYQIMYGLIFDFVYQHSSTNFNNIVYNDNAFWGKIRIDID